MQYQAHKKEVVGEAGPPLPLKSLTNLAKVRDLPLIDPQGEFCGLPSPCRVAGLRRLTAARAGLSTRRMLTICAVLGMMCGPAPAQEAAPPLVGRAVVTDGDTVIVAGRTVRLQGIDAPEISQPCARADGSTWWCGAAAGRDLDRIIAGRQLRCEIDARDPGDRYGRVLAICFAGGADIGREMLARGQAVAYRRYLDYRGGAARAHKADYLAAEAGARARGAGVWQGDFTLPEEWRRAKRR
jgi:endonuclease YncB( thermonuclease family)